MIKPQRCMAVHSLTGSALAPVRRLAIDTRSWACQPRRLLSSPVRRLAIDTRSWACQPRRLLSSPVYDTDRAFYL